MKKKAIMAVLAATVSLGACEAPREHHYAAADPKRTVYEFRGEELGSADVRKVQRSLAAEGFYQGKIDGVWGVETSQAILGYQTTRHPDQTSVTVDTLREFGLRMDEDYYREHHTSRP